MRFEIYKDSNGQFRWRLVTANGRIIANSGEGYHNEADCNNGVSLVMGTNDQTPYRWA